MSDEQPEKLIAGVKQTDDGELYNSFDTLGIQICDALGIDYKERFVAGLTLRVKAGRVPIVSVDFYLWNDEWEKVKDSLKRFRVEPIK